MGTEPTARTRSVGTPVLQCPCFHTKGTAPAGPYMKTTRPFGRVAVVPL